MIADLDEALKTLLLREMPVKNGEVEIEFDQPRREWSARLSRPTLNVFLHDLRENNTLRQPRWEVGRHGDGAYDKRRAPARVDLHYMITAWVPEAPEDEHRLITRALMALLRFPEMPEDLLAESLQNQPMPVPLRVAEHDVFTNAPDLWGVLDNELRPAVSLVVTLAFNPYARIEGPLVWTRELRVGQAAEQPGKPLNGKFASGAEAEKFWMVGGTLTSSELPVKDLTLTLVERGLTVAVRPENADETSQTGSFTIGNLLPGEYTLGVSVQGRKLRRRKLTVPSESYDISV